MSKRRRAFGPKRKKNTKALIKFLALALAVAVVGLLIAWLLLWLIGSPPEAPAEQTDKPVSILYSLPGMVLVAASLAVLALIFFGIRAYLMGTATRTPILKNRRKIKTT